MWAAPELERPIRFLPKKQNISIIRKMQAPVISSLDEYVPPTFTDPSAIAIQTKTITKTSTITAASYKVEVARLELYTSVTVLVTLFDEKGGAVDSQTLKIEGAEYLAWQNDDSYLVNLVATKLGLTKA
jgi:hypothetical protein